MTLVDAGPLIALVDRDEADHAVCAKLLRTLSAPLVTTWPAFAEAMYILGDRTGWTGQEGLWRMVLTTALEIRALDLEQLQRAHDNMKKYRDLPMDLADATLVILACDLSITRIFTLDDDFRVYRLPNKRAFEIIPELP